MTDNEIIKAFTEIVEFCRKCENLTKESDVLGAVLDLINRKNAEIERLEKVQVQYVKAYFDEFAERLKNDFRLAQLDIGLTSAVVDELVETMNNEFNTLADFTDLIKAEAVEKLANRLKAKALSTKRGGRLGVIDCFDIEELKKEVVGES